MFIVFNKQKIQSYLIAFGTVVTLFVFAFAITQNHHNSILTSSNAKELPIYCVETQEKKLAFTMNCAWSQLQMG